LSDDHKRARQTIYQGHLDCHAREGDAFLHRIVTGDQSRVYHYKPEGKGQSMQWKHLLSLANKKFKTQASNGKVMLTISWNVKGPILVHFKEKGQTVISARYNDMLVNELKPVIDRNAGDFPQREYCCFTTMPAPIWLRIVDTLHALKFEVLQHPSYSPDLAPSDYHLFGPTKEHLRGQKFADDEVMEVVQSWLKATPKSFSLEGIRKLVDKWAKCVVKQGDYVEK